MKTSDVQVYFGIFRYQGKDIIYKDQVKNHIKLWIAILRKWTCKTIRKSKCRKLEKSAGTTW